MDLCVYSAKKTKVYFLQCMHNGTLSKRLKKANTNNVMAGASDRSIKSSGGKN
jgi:hypothetical protein